MTDTEVNDEEMKGIDHHKTVLFLNGISCLWKAKHLLWKDLRYGDFYHLFGGTLCFLPCLEKSSLTCPLGTAMVQLLWTLPGPAVTKSCQSLLSRPWC